MMLWGLNVSETREPADDCKKGLKGQCHEIFCFCFFSWISFPPAPEYSIQTVSNFFENSRRYSRVKVHHRYQRHRWQVFPPFSLVLVIPAANLPLVSTIPAANLPPVSTMPVANCYWYNDTGGKFATGGKKWQQYQAADTLKWTWRQKCIYMLTLLPKGVQTKLLKFFCLKVFSICHRCRWHRWQTLSCEYLREFSKNSKGPNSIIRGLGETGSRKKTRSKKSRDTVPLSACYNTQAGFSKGIFLPERDHDNAWQIEIIRQFKSWPSVILLCSRKYLIEAIR